METPGVGGNVSAAHVINASNAKPSREGAETNFHGNGVHSQCAEYYLGTKQGGPEEPMLCLAGALGLPGQGQAAEG